MLQLVPSLRSSSIFARVRLASSPLASVSRARERQHRAFHSPYTVLYAAGANPSAAQTSSSQPVAFTYEKQLDAPIDSGAVESSAAAAAASPSSCTAPNLTAAFTMSEDIIPSADKDANVFPRVHVVSAPDPNQTPYKVPLGVYPVALPFAH